MVSSVKSGLFSIATGAMGGLWGTGPGAAEVVAKADPDVTLSTRHALRDEGRQGQELLLSPNKVYCAVRDGQNRVMVVETSSGTVVQAWRGYHRVQLAWTVTSQAREAEVTTGLQLAVLLLLYLPRRGLIEVWSPEQKTKVTRGNDGVAVVTVLSVQVTEFHVSQHGLLLNSCLAALDDGIPRRRETVSTGYLTDVTHMFHVTHDIAHTFYVTHVTLLACCTCDGIGMFHVTLLTNSA